MYSIVFPIDNNFAAYCAVTITSIIQATNAKNMGGGKLH